MRLEYFSEFELSHIDYLLRRCLGMFDNKKQKQNEKRPLSEGELQETIYESLNHTRNMKAV